MPSGSHRETGKRERERARAGKHRQKETAREREWHSERDRGWNIANHRISILMLRGGAIVNVEGATLGSFEFYIGPTDRFAAAQRLRFESLDRSSNESAKSLSPISCYFFFLCAVSAIAQVSLRYNWTVNNREPRTEQVGLEKGVRSDHECTVTIEM